jgi:hypothetical protein
LGRPNAYQPAALADGDPVFALIAYNENAVMTQDGVGAAGEAVKSGVGHPVAPASFFVHEAAEKLAFRSQGNWDYPQAHNAAIRREGQIRQDLRWAGGWAGGHVHTTVPRR